LPLVAPLAGAASGSAITEGHGVKEITRDSVPSVKVRVGGVVSIRKDGPSQIGIRHHWGGQTTSESVPPAILGILSLEDRRRFAVVVDKTVFNYLLTDNNLELVTRLAAAR